MARISDSTVWRWLHEDAIRPWQHRCWIFPRDPHFQAKAGRILDLYERRWQGQPLREDEYVISADEKTSIQARLRIHPSLPSGPGKTMRVEHEYVRGGAWAYLAALDVHRAKVFGRCEATTGIAPFERLVDQVMSQAPYDTARRVFWVMDNGSSHRGQASVQRLMKAHPRLVPVHGPVHASWLNQIEIYFSIVQRKVLTPERLPLPGGGRRATGELRALLRKHRSSIRVEVHPRRSQRLDRANAHSPGAQPAPQAGSLKYVSELLKRTT